MTNINTKCFLTSCVNFDTKSVYILPRRTHSVFDTLSFIPDSLLNLLISPIANSIDNSSLNSNIQSSACCTILISFTRSSTSAILKPRISLLFLIFQ